MSYTPCVNDEAIFYGAKRALRIVDFAQDEHPIAVQLLSKDERYLLPAAQKMIDLGCDIIDLNMGCPTRRVVGGGRGAALLRDLSTVERLVRTLVEQVEVPITAKIRLGWDAQSRNYLQVAELLESCGISAIAVHGRTRAQKYSGTADWEAIAEIKAHVSIPVLGNGDVRSVADIERIQRITGCDAVLIGRAAIGNPWIFSRRSIESVSFDERLAMIRRHLRAMVAYYGEHHGVILFRKHVVKYVHGLPGTSALRPKLLAATSAKDVIAILEGWAPIQRAVAASRTL